MFGMRSKHDSHRTASFDHGSQLRTSRESEGLLEQRHYGLNYLKVTQGNVMFDITEAADVTAPDVGQ